MITLKPPTPEELGEAAVLFAKGGFVHTGILFKPETECEQVVSTTKTMAETRPITVFEGGWQMPTDQVWEPMYPLVSHSVSQTFPMSAIRLRQFMKILGDYRLPGDKPLIHKGKKR